MKMNVLDMSPALCDAQLWKNKEQDIGECLTLGHELSHPLYLNFNSFASQVGYLGQCFVCRLHLLCFLYTFIFSGWARKSSWSDLWWKGIAGAWTASSRGKRWVSSSCTLHPAPAQPRGHAGAGALPPFILVEMRVKASHQMALENHVFWFVPLVWVGRAQRQKDGSSDCLRFGSLQPCFATAPVPGGVKDLLMSGAPHVIYVI